MQSSISYDQISDRLENLSLPSEATRFNIEWIIDGLIAVGRDSRGGHVVILEGDRIAPTQPSTERAIRLSAWQSTNGEQVVGNLLALPTGGEFRAACAAIVAELLRHGAGARSPTEVFPEVEPLIELIIQQLLLPPESALGLLGELFILTEMLDAMPTSHRINIDPTTLWKGWTRAARDFNLGGVSIEVKTTSGDVPRHFISGLHQVEPAKLDGGSLEQLYLASFGFKRSHVDGPISVRALAEKALRQLAPDGSDGVAYDDRQRKFLDRLAEYGPANCAGYEHERMRDREPYTHCFTTTYPPRMYDLNDNNLRLLRRADLVGTFVPPEGLQYKVELPDHVPGSIENPVMDIRRVLTAAIKKL